MRGRGPVAIIGSVALMALSCSAQVPAQSGQVIGSYDSEEARFHVELITDRVDLPFAMAFLPDGRALVSERRIGRMSILDVETGDLTPLDGVPEVKGRRQGGLMDIELHPDYEANGWIYFSYSDPGPDGNTTVVERARLQGGRLADRVTIFEARPRFPTMHHYGSRLGFHDGYLFITVGDRGNRDRAQNLDSHNGKVMRLHDDGRVPDDNPFVGRAGALPEIWSYGHRNPQGLAIHPETGEPWIHEHGPRGGDEINISRPGLNYGWPVITYGEEYRGGPVGAGITHHEGMEQPLYYYVPSIAPSGMTFYTGGAFPDWRGDLLIGAHALEHLNRLELGGERVTGEERLLGDRDWGIRFVEQGPDGLVYIGHDEGIVRLRPR